MSTPQVRTKLGLESAGMRMSPEQFDAITEYDDRYCYELVHGVLHVNPIPSEAEADPNEELGHLLRAYRDEHPQGAAMGSHAL